MADENLTWETVTEILLQEHSTRHLEIEARQEKDSKRNARALKTMSRVKCYNCGKRGHYKRDCRVLLKTGYSHSVKDAEKENYGNKALIGNLAKSKDIENVIDSGASKHMFALKDSFSNIKESEIERVKLSDGRKVFSNMSGTVPLCTINGNTRIRLLLHDVMFVTGLETNLVSCAELTKQGYTISFCQDSCDIQKSVKSVATVFLNNGLYVLNRTNCAQNDEVANLSSTSLKGIRLWHLRF